MTDEQLVIRHVRLCECGLPANHETVCRPSRMASARQVDDDWENAETARRAERWAKREQQLNSERRVGRARLGAWELHRLAVERVAKLSAVPGAQIAPSRGGGDGAGPPRQQDLDDDPRWRACWEVISRQLKHAHLLIDEAEGHGPVAERALSAEEKDALIVDPDNANLSVAQLIQSLGVEVCGSASTVNRVRSRFRAGLCTRNGMAPDPGCRCPTCRRVA